MLTSRTHILIAAGDTLTCCSQDSPLRHLPCHTYFAQDLEGVADICERHPIEVVIWLQTKLPVPYSHLRRALGRSIQAPLLVTADLDGQAPPEAAGVLAEPLRLVPLLNTIERVLIKKDDGGNGVAPRTEQFDDLVGGAESMLTLYHLIESVAPSEANILITGESGTGKELVARSLHKRSRRAESPFVPVNCSALPEHLFEAELFGYEKGAFTGANRRKAGLLEYADGGSFFLDEVCELPVPLQAKLLRVMQEKKLRHLGSNVLVDIDVRLISASNRNLDHARTDGTLRSDFYFRLNVVNIHVPPLRDRIADIRLLAEHFLRQFGRSSAKVISGFEPEVIALFESYSWPGNVRELENIIERAIAVTGGDVISMVDLPAQLSAGKATNGAAHRRLTLAEAKQRAIARVEQSYLRDLLEKHKGNVTRVAKEAGMTRRNIHRLLNRHAIDPWMWKRTVT